MNLKKLAEENLRAELGVDEEMEKLGWKAMLWVLPGILFISYLIARTVATFVWGV